MSLQIDLLSAHLSGINFHVDAGECICIEGESGSGKTLLLRAIADLDPNEGSVFLDETERNRLPADQWRKKVGYLPADSYWWSERVRDHFDTSTDRLEQLALNPNILDWSVSRLSTGEKQRLALLRCLELEPSVLLLDEITANLDSDNTAKVETLIHQQLEKGTHVIWVSHDAKQRERMANRVFHMQQGQIHLL